MPLPAFWRIDYFSPFSFALLVIIFFHNFIANYEEKFLLQKYGEDCEMYRKRTGKGMPKIG
jgi:protein-S-isoprenylcysteine O-methyltransferase Ste14